MPFLLLDYFKLLDAEIKLHTETKKESFNNAEQILNDMKADQ